MRVELMPGEQVSVTFHDSDGEIHVAFSEHEIRVEADLPDTEGRAGVIYRERFADVDLDARASYPGEKVERLVARDASGAVVGEGVAFSAPARVPENRSGMSALELARVLVARLENEREHTASRQGALMNELAGALGLAYSPDGGFEAPSLLEAAHASGLPFSARISSTAEVVSARIGDQRDHDGEVGARAALLMREVVCEQVYRARASWDPEHPCRALELRKIDPAFVSLAALELEKEAGAHANGRISASEYRIVAGEFLDGKRPRAQ